MFQFSIPQTWSSAVVKSSKGEFFLYNMRASTLLATKEREGEAKEKTEETKVSKDTGS